MRQLIMTNTLDNLTELLRELPGIGPRQARRLAFYMVRRDKAWVDAFARTLLDARREVQTCTFCMRLFPTTQAGGLCSICANTTRDTHTLMVVEKDVDLENIERTGVYKGRYFVLGGTAGLLDKEPEKKIRVRSLEKMLDDATQTIKELIYALSATTEGEDTVAYLQERLAPLTQHHAITATILGRGLSTGTELEYVDAETMKNALRGRV
ncbi:MAG: recombination protein RecR [Candidatus Pacebacteria bacterium]|nr:recombination protein RecR [Candidatus Paceibacterota bacterium]